MFVGYVRVSTQEQSLQLQLDALEAAGCEKIFEETASGAQHDRPQLQAALDYARAGDCLVVWKLDRVARSLKQLIETVERLGEREIGFRSLTERIDTTSAGGKLTFHIFGALAEFARGIKRPLYRRYGVSYLWLVEPIEHVLETYRHSGSCDTVLRRGATRPGQPVGSYRFAIPWQTAVTSLNLHLGLPHQVQGSIRAGRDAGGCSVELEYGFLSSLFGRNHSENCFISPGLRSILSTSPWCSSSSAIRRRAYSSRRTDRSRVTSRSSR